ncbi:MAG: CoA transferase [Burkholderiaceae bacterium]|nr:CoA transferase [Burkholderiaceae bacterium]
MSASRASLRPLRGVRILSLALNLPGPAALLRCQAMGASCTKLEPPSGDPMQHYSPTAYAALHAGVKVARADLKTDAGQACLSRELARADVLLTSFRPSALQRLGLGRRRLRRDFPALSQVAIVGGVGAQAEVPGHDLTYLAERGLVTGLDLPATLYADMSGSLMAGEAVLQAVLTSRMSGSTEARGVFIEVALAGAAAWLARPRDWRLTTPDAPIGGAHAGYRVYPCRGGRVAVAALEPHFAQALCAVAGVPINGPADLLSPRVHTAIAAFLATRTRAQLDALAATHDLPLHTLPRGTTR